MSVLAFIVLIKSSELSRRKLNVKSENGLRSMSGTNMTLKSQMRQISVRPWARPTLPWVKCCRHHDTVSLDQLSGMKVVIRR